MDRRRIAVLTDLDLAEYFLRKGDSGRALEAASVALENALQERDRCDPKTSACEEWNRIVSEAFKVKSRVLRASSD